MIVMLKKQIIAIRPFHMANFSSGASMAIGLFLISIPVVIMPAILVAVGGAFLRQENKAAELQERSQQVQFMNVKARLNATLLPIFIVITGLFVPSMISHQINYPNMVNSSAGGAWFIMLITLGFYAASLLSGYALSKVGNLTVGKWTLATLFSCAIVLFCGIAIVAILRPPLDCVILLPIMILLASIIYWVREVVLPWIDRG